MSTQVLLVRAINVGGAKLPMAEFREMLAELGAEHVRTYIQTGNAVVELSGDPDAFARLVEKGMKDRYGYQREVIVRTPAQLKMALKQHPFEVSEPKFSYVMPLTGTPAKAAVQKAEEVDTGSDQWALIGDDLHVRYANGAGQAELDMNKVLRRLGVQGTARNLLTVQKIIDLAES